MDIYKIIKIGNICILVVISGINTLLKVIYINYCNILINLLIMFNIKGLITKVLVNKKNRNNKKFKMTD